MYSKQDIANIMLKEIKFNDWRNLIDWNSLCAPEPTIKGLAWTPLLRVDPDPATQSGDGGGGVTKAASVEAASSPDTSTSPAKPPAKAEDDIINNPEGLLSTLNKYKQFGSVKEIERSLKDLDQFNRIMESIQSQGISSIGEIPKALQKMRDDEAARLKAEEDLQARVERELAAKETEWQQKLIEAETAKATAETDLISAYRKIAVQKYYDVNCKPEFVEDYDFWYAKISPFIKFKEGTAEIESILNPDGTQLMVTGSDNKVRAAGMVDMFNALVEGKYGPMASAPLKPVSAARGGTALNPANTTNGSNVRITADFDYGKASPEQLRAIKKGNYIVT